MAHSFKKKETVIEEAKSVEIPVEEMAEQPVVEKPVKKATKKTVVKIKNPRVNIRKSPSLMGEVLMIASAKDKFDFVADSDDGFYEITVNGSPAFVMKEYAELV